MPQAGWYLAPGEQGTLRWWSGTNWTADRQPLPAVEPPVAPIAPPFEPAVVPLAEPPAPALEPAAEASPARSRIAPITGMIAALLVAVIGLAVIGLLSQQNSVGAGEVQSSGVVTDQGWQLMPGSTNGVGQRECYPIASFTVDGTKYLAHSSIGSPGCPVQVGQSVPVAYLAANPESSGRVAIANSAPLLLWAIPAIALLGFVASLVLFIRRRIPATD